MPKNIIVLSDGTGNSSAKLFKTNVWRTYEALDLSDPKKQVARYYNGVGTSSFRPIALVTGAIGIGLSRNVRELYAFLCQNYNPGDRIYGFGFSRGAFTIRILADFVAQYGLLKRDANFSEQDIWKKTRWLYRLYRKEHSGSGTVPFLATVIRGLRDLWPRQAMEAETYKSFLHRGVEIEFLGLWDTVDAYGSPIDEMTKGWDTYVWPLSMRNYNLSKKVKRAVHALSLDDERNSFHPLLWNEAGEFATRGLMKKELPFIEAKNIKEERLTQVWFSGMHADVGGGYADDFLSYVPLNWVLSQVGPNLILNALTQQYRDAERVFGVMHDSRAGLQSYYRPLPRKLEKLLKTRRTRFELSIRKGPKLVEANVVEITRPKIHHSVFDRIRVKGMSYSPIVLPKDYAVVTKAGKIENLGSETFESKADAGSRSKAQERAWDTVWWWRINYFTTLFVTFCLALLPLLYQKGDGKCTESEFCFVAGIPKFFEFLLPTYVAPWIEVFSAHPGVLGVLAYFVYMLTIVGIWQKNKIHTRMTAIWHPSAELVTGFSHLHAFRESKAYQWTLRTIKIHVLPFGFGMAALFSIFIIVVSLQSRVVFSIADFRGDFCNINSGVQLTPLTFRYSNKLEFSPSEVCWPTGLAVEKGATYRVVMNIAGTMGSWKDDTLEADLLGNAENHSLFTSILAWPSKRYIWENYYKPIARIRTHAPRAYQDEYVLNSTFNSSRKRYDCLVSDFTAQYSGEMFLFVNDAIIYFKPNGWIDTYGNNRGMAEVFVKRIATSGESFLIPPEMIYASACSEFSSSP